MASLGHNIIANYVGRAWAAVLGIRFIQVYLRFMGLEADGLVGFYMTLSLSRKSDARRPAHRS